VSEPNEIPLKCLSCGTIGHYKKEMLETFGKVRCTNCNEDISLVPYKLTEQLKMITEYASMERTDDWGKDLDELWDYVSRNSKELDRLDPQFLFDTTVQLFLNGVTFIPSRDYTQREAPYKEKSIIKSLLVDKFDPTPHFPSGIPQYESLFWRKMFAVHNQVVNQIVELGENILCIEEGMVEMGTGNRSRNGSIFLTNKRLIVIGRESINAHGDTQSYPVYPKVEDYTIMAHRNKLAGNDAKWRYLVSPKPSAANIYGSVDYFDLQKIQKMNLKKTYIDLSLGDFSYVDIVPREISIPVIHPAGAVAQWFRVKGPTKKKMKTGQFKVRISLGRITAASKNKSELQSRHGKFAEVLLEAAKAVHQHQPAPT
jgi:hypothetical protein